MDKKKTAIAVLSGFVVCALVVVLLLGLYAGGLMGKNKKDPVKGQEDNSQEINSSKLKVAELHDGMTLNEFRAWFALTEIKSMTMTQFSYDGDGNVTEKQINYFVENGVLQEIRDNKDEITKYNLSLFEDNRYYEQTYSSDGWKTRIIELENAKIHISGGSFAVSGKVGIELMHAFFGYFASSSFESEYFTIPFSVKDGVVTTSNLGDGDLILKDFNKTTLPIREDFKDYKSRPATDTLGKFENATVNDEDCYKLVDIDDLYSEDDVVASTRIIKYVVPETYDGKAVKEVDFTNGFNKSNLQEIVISKNVVKIYADKVEVPSITFVGTIADWANVDLTGFNSSKDVTVHCTDGDVKIAGNA